MRDAREKGRTSRGSRNGGSKISEQTAAEIKVALALRKETQGQISRRLGVSRKLVSHIATGNSWAWLKVTRLGAEKTEPILKEVA